MVEKFGVDPYYQDLSTGRAVEIRIFPRRQDPCISAIYMTIEFF